MDGLTCGQAPATGISHVVHGQSPREDENALFPEKMLFQLGSEIRNNDTDLSCARAAPRAQFFSGLMLESIET